jgi:histidine triad (HIT) family protein
MPADCPFCEIATGRLDQEIVYADDGLIAFLCEPPATWGHTLVVPRKHVEDIWSIEPGQAATAMKVAKELAHAMRDELGAIGVHLRQNSGSGAGQDVFHFHLHVVPRYENDTVQPGCVWGAPPWQPPAGGDAERRRVADALRSALG